MKKHILGKSGGYERGMDWKERRRARFDYEF